MTIRITYKIGEHPYAKGREIELPAKPTDVQARTIVAGWWGCPESEIKVESVTEVDVVPPLSSKGLTERHRE